MMLEKNAGDAIFGKGSPVVRGTIAVDFHGLGQKGMCNALGVPYEDWYIVRISIGLGDYVTVDAINLRAAGIEHGKQLREYVDVNAPVEVTTFTAKRNLGDILLDRNLVKGLSIYLNGGPSEDFVRGDNDILDVGEI